MQNRLLLGMATVTIAAGGVGTARAAPAATIPGPQAASDHQQLEQVVVTASKRATNVQKTPISIASISGVSAMKRGDTQLDQVLARVGAVRILEGEDGPTFYIRGIGTGVPSSVGDPEVNLNIDGVYQSEPEFSRAGLYDVNRVEVARGPQGTLYGRNAVAGVVNIVTNDPSRVYSGGISLGTGNYGLFQSQGFLNLPLSDTLAVRVAFGTENHNGYLSNGADDLVAQSGRAKLLWQPNADVKLVVTADATHEGGQGEGEIQIDPPPPGFPIPTHALGDVFTSSNPWTSPDPGDARRRTRFYNVHAQLDWNLGFGVLTVLPAYRAYDYRCLNCWRSETDQNQFASEHQETVEVRIASPAGSRIKWLAGVYMLHANSPNFGQNLGPGASSFTDASGNEVSEQAQQKFISESYAAFAEGTYPILPALRLTAGARGTLDQKSETGYVLGEAGGVINVCSTATPPPYTSQAECEFHTAKAFRSFTYNVGVEGDLAPNSLAYAKVSSGYKAGGFYQGAAPDVYQPEQLTAYEIGSKNRFLNSTLQVNASVFYYNYKNYQVNYISFINPTAAGIFGINTSNAQGATLYGAELETRYRFTATDELDAAVYPLHAKFNHLIIGGIFGGNYSHLQLPFAPTMSFNLGYQHVFDFRSGASLTTRIETHIENGTWVTFQEVPGTHQKTNSTSNAVITYQFPNQHWSVAGFIKNLENTPVLVNAQGGPAMLEAGDIGPPRTYGVQLTAGF